MLHEAPSATNLGSQVKYFRAFQTFPCKRPHELPDVEAVYSVGGSNAAIKKAFTQLQRPCRTFIAHDLDVDNLRLQRDGTLHAVLHYDLQQDLRPFHGRPRRGTG